MARTVSHIVLPSDPCRASRQVKKFDGYAAALATELLHLPQKAAGVEDRGGLTRLATELLRLPRKAAGVVKPRWFYLPSR